MYKMHEKKGQTFFTHDISTFLHDRLAYDARKYLKEH